MWKRTAESQYGHLARTLDVKIAQTRHKELQLSYLC